VINQLVLVGLPGAGKSAVGRALAARLNWAFVDFDEEISRESGRSVAEIFSVDGEAAFRAMEHSMTLRYRDTSKTVLSPGGGWVAQPAVRALLLPSSRIIHLIVSPGEAARRIGDRQRERPLLAGATDLVDRLGRLADERAAAYASAHRSVLTDGLAVDEVVSRVLSDFGDER
jgi:shikimate kinase